MVANRGLYRANIDPSRIGKELAVDADGVLKELDYTQIDRSRRIFVFEDFYGKQLDTNRWGTQDTSAAGTPTLALVDDAADGQFQLAFDTQNEAQNITLYWNDNQSIPTAKAPMMIIRLKVSATPNANDKLVFGLASGRNATLDNIVTNAWGMLVGADLSLFLESDDNATDSDDKDTGVDLVADTFIEFKIDMADITNVLFYYRTTLGNPWIRLDGANTKFSVNSAAVQPFIELQKSSGAQVTAVKIDYIYLSWDRT